MAREKNMFGAHFLLEPFTDKIEDLALKINS